MPGPWWQDGSVSCTTQSPPSYWLMPYSRAQPRCPGPHPTAQQHRVAWHLLLGRSTVGTKASPAAKTSQELQLLTMPSRSGFLPSDSCLRTDAAGARLCRVGSHISPLRESLIHAKGHTCLDPGRHICLFLLTPELFSSLPVPSSIAFSSLGTSHLRGRGIYGQNDVPQMFKVPISHLKFHSRRGKGKREEEKHK